MRADVYNAVKTVRDSLEKQGKLDTLDTVDRRLLDRFLRDYRRNGLDLDEEKQNRIKEIKKELNDLSINFGRNLAEDKTTIEVTRDELKGMTEDFIGGLKKSEKDESKYVLTLDYPIMFPILRQCDVEETRRKIEFAYGNRCREENIPIMKRTIQLRQDLATLLGYPTYAEYALEVRMAKNTKTVMDFLNDIRGKLAEIGETEKQTLLKLKSEITQQEVSKEFRAWDYNYLIQKHTERNYSINDEELSQYFPAEHVMKGMLEIYQRVLGVRFEREKPDNKSAWHEDVELYSVYDAAGGAFVGQFYLDMFPRDGKYSHAACWGLVPTMVTSSKGDDRQFPVSAMVCNFTKPTAGKPSLLRHSEVVTLLHEFGHCVHGVLSVAKYSNFSGTRVELDFVECPSQALENWGWHPDGLRLLSKHYQTGEVMPESLISRLVASRHVCSALFYLRQLFFGFFDMTVHTVKTSDEAAAVDPVELWAKLRREITLVEHTQGTAPAGTFNHILGGYAAGYYSYLASLVYACDLFSKFTESGDVFSAEVGDRLRKTLLSQGGMKDGDELIRSFLGREPNNVAFLRDIGVTKQE
jgi:Zn-dependent oligopeptidase